MSEAREYLLDPFGMLEIDLWVLKNCIPDDFEGVAGIFLTEENIRKAIVALYSIYDEWLPEMEELLWRDYVSSKVIEENMRDLADAFVAGMMGGTYRRSYRH